MKPPGKRKVACPEVLDKFTPGQLRLIASILAQLEARGGAFAPVAFALDAIHDALGRPKLPRKPWLHPQEAVFHARQLLGEELKRMEEVAGKIRGGIDKEARYQQIRDAYDEVCKEMPRAPLKTIYDKVRQRLRLLSPPPKKTSDSTIERAIGKRQ